MRKLSRSSRLAAVVATASLIVCGLVSAAPAQAATPGSAVMWGYTSATSDSEFAAAVSGKKVLNAALGADGGVALLSDHALVIWGTTDYGLHTAPTIPAHRQVIQVAAGYFTYYALLDNGQVLGWGQGLSSNAAFAAMNTAGHVTQIDARGSGGIALHADGSVSTWIVSAADYYDIVADTPTVTAAKDFTQVAMGSNIFAMALHEDGSVLAWGFDSAVHGDNLGAGGSPLVSISAGFYHALGLRENGDVVAWGQEQGDEISAIDDALDGQKAIGVCANLYESTVVRADGTVVSLGVDGDTLVTEASSVIGDAFIGDVYCGPGNAIAVASTPKVSVTRSGSPIANASVARGETVNVEGSALTRNSDFTLLFDGEQVGTGIADASGAFASIPFEVPTSASLGTHHLVFQSDDYTLDTKFTVGGALPVPTLTGTLRVGQTLTAAPGTWTAGTTFAYVWLRDGKTISGASSATYQLAPADRAHTIQVKVTGTRGLAISSATSAKTAKVGYGTIASDLPEVTGSAQVGQTLSVDPGTWTPAAAVSYQWYLNGAAISKATKSTLVVPSSALGRRISVRLVGASSGYTSVTRLSERTSVVDEGVMSNGTISFSSPLQVAKPVKAIVSGWPSGATITYQWSDEFGPIYGATKSSYTPRADQRNSALYVEVTAAKTGYAGTYLQQYAGAIYGTFVASTPKITGSPKVGQVLTASTGTWTPAASLTYSWLRVHGSTSTEVGTGTTYTLTLGDKGSKIVLKVTGSSSNYVSLTVTSKATSTIS